LRKPLRSSDLKRDSGNALGSVEAGGRGSTRAAAPRPPPRSSTVTQEPEPEVLNWSVPPNLTNGHTPGVSYSTTSHIQCGKHILRIRARDNVRQIIGKRKVTGMIHRHAPNLIALVGFVGTWEGMAGKNKDGGETRKRLRHRNYYVCSSLIYPFHRCTHPISQILAAKRTERSHCPLNLLFWRFDSWALAMHESGYKVSVQIGFCLG
jgi:hypothetical protein